MIYEPTLIVISHRRAKPAHAPICGPRINCPCPTVRDATMAPGPKKPEMDFKKHAKIVFED